MKFITTVLLFVFTTPVFADSLQCYRYMGEGSSKPTDTLPFTVQSVPESKQNPFEQALGTLEGKEFSFHLADPKSDPGYYGFEILVKTSSGWKTVAQTTAAGRGLTYQFIDSDSWISVWCRNN